MLIIKKETYCLSLGLIFLISTSGLYFILNAQFNGMLQILLSLLIIIFLFCYILFLSKNLSPVQNLKKQKLQLFSLMLLIFLFFLMFFLALTINYQEQVINNITIIPQSDFFLSLMQNFATRIVSNHILNLKLVSMMLFVTIIAIHLISNQNKKEDN